MLHVPDASEVFFVPGMLHGHVKKANSEPSWGAPLSRLQNLKAQVHSVTAAKKQADGSRWQDPTGKHYGDTQITTAR